MLRDETRIGNDRPPLAAGASPGDDRVSPRRDGRRGDAPRPGPRRRGRLSRRGQARGRITRGPPGRRVRPAAVRPRGRERRGHDPTRGWPAATRGWTGSCPWLERHAGSRPLGPREATQRRHLAAGLPEAPRRRPRMDHRRPPLRPRRRTPRGTRLHTFMFGCPAFRTVAPFDWLAFLRQWRLEFVEVREGGRVYYRITGQLKEALGPTLRRTCPTTGPSSSMRRSRSARWPARGPALPAFLRGPDWERASRGLLAVAISNQDGAFAKSYDLAAPDDAVVLSLFKGVDLWTFAVEDADALVLRAAAACRGGDVSEVIARSIDSLREAGPRRHRSRRIRRKRNRRTTSAMFRMIKSLMANVRVSSTPTARSASIPTDSGRSPISPR